MSQTVEAIYEKGVFRPLTPVQLAEHQSVRLTVESQSRDTALTPQQIWEEAGRLRPLGSALEEMMVSDSVLEEVREALAKAGGKPLSEIIIEQRGRKP